MHVIQVFILLWIDATASTVGTAHTIGPVTVEQCQAYVTQHPNAECALPDQLIGYLDGSHCTLAGALIDYPKYIGAKDSLHVCTGPDDAYPRRY